MESIAVGGEPVTLLRNGLNSIWDLHIQSAEFDFRQARIRRERPSI